MNHSNKLFKYKAILTDLGNVVVLFERRKVAEGLHEFVPHRTIDEIDNAINKSPDGAFLLEKFETAGISAKDYHTGVEKILHVKIPSKKFWQIHVSLFEPNQPMIRFLRVVRFQKQHVDRLIAVSNTDPIRLEKMVTLSTLNFDTIVSSYQARTKKPHPGIFTMARTCAAAPAEECIFIDDKKSYVDAARSYGFVGIHYDAQTPGSFEKLMVDLKRFGFLLEETG